MSDTEKRELNGYLNVATIANMLVPLLLIL